MAMGNAADLLAYGGGAAPGTSAKPGNASIDRTLRPAGARKERSSEEEALKRGGEGGGE
jgi:hypothetical protein